MAAHINGKPRDDEPVGGCTAFKSDFRRPTPPPPLLGRNLQTSLSCKSLPSCSYRSRCSSKVRFLNIWKKTQVEPWLYTVPGLEDGLGRNEEGGLRYLVQDHLDGEALEDDE